MPTTPTTNRSSALLGDIAQRTGLSLRTVVRILNAGPLRDTRPSIVRRAEQVRALAEEMGYHPNAAACAVATGRFNAATLLMSTEEGRSRSSVELMRRLHEALNLHDMHLSVAWLPGENLLGETVLPKVLRKWMCDGLVINYTHHIPAAMVETIERHRLPSIWLNCTRKTDCVRPDDVKAGRLATRPLLERGCRRIVFLEVGANEHDSVSARRQGYQSAMAAAGLPAEIVTLPLPGNARAGSSGEARAAILRDWLSQRNRPDGVVTYSAWTAEPLLYAAAQLGMGVPDDLSVTTIEDEPALHLGRLVTTVVLDVEKLAAVAVEMLRCKITAPTESLSVQKIVPHLVRGDTA